MYLPKRANCEKLGLGIDNPCRIVFFFWVCRWTSAWRGLMIGIFGILETFATPWYQDVALTQEFFFSSSHPQSMLFAAQKPQNMRTPGDELRSFVDCQGNYQTGVNLSSFHVFCFFFPFSFPKGANSHGQLGLGYASEECKAPTLVSKLPGELESSLGRVKCVVGGGGHTLLLTHDGAVYSCGWNTKVWIVAVIHVLNHLYLTAWFC